MTVYRFERITQLARKRVSCDDCGKKITRQRTFEMTLNPFNTNDDGTIRTRYDIREALLARKRAWEATATGELCTPCLTARWERRYGAASTKGHKGEPA